MKYLNLLRNWLYVYMALVRPSIYPNSYDFPRRKSNKRPIGHMMFDSRIVRGCTYRQQTLPAVRLMASATVIVF